MLRPIGRGAYGEVWLARNVMGALRAVKVIWRRQFEHDRPFEREFAGIQRFEPVSRSSGGLVHVLHVGRNDAEGYFYYVMELADRLPSADGAVTNGDGEIAATDSYSPRTLRSDLIQRRRLPPGDCLRLAIEIVSGLAQLHRQGLVHRDVKPGNIIYVQGRAKLADIGLVSSGDEGRTFVGTEGYIPPEGPGSPAADLYALGIVLYESSTGYSPEKFPDVPPEWFTEQADGDALEFHEIILKACEAQRDRRYASAERMQADLALLQSGQSIRRTRALERRYAQLRWSGIVGTVLLVCALGGVLFANYRARIASEISANEAKLRQHAQDLLVRAESAEQEARQQLYTALLEQARATVVSGELGHRVRALDALRRAAAISNTAALRGVAMAALALPDLSFERELPVAPEAMVKLDPAFERIALCRNDGPVEIRAVQDDRLLATLPASTRLMTYVIHWSSNGRFLAVKRDHPPSGARADWEIWEVAGPKCVLLLRDNPRGAFAFHPRLPRIILGREPATASIRDLETGRELARHPLAGTPVILKFGPDGQSFAASIPLGTNWMIAVHDANDGTLQVSQQFTNAVTDFNWHPSGRWLGVPDHSGVVQLMDVRTGETRTLGRHKANAVVAEFTSDGRYLFSGGWDRELICWDVKAMRRAFSIALDSVNVQLSSDGRQCAVVRAQPEARVQLHTLERPVPREFAEDLGGPRGFAAFSSEGRWLAASGDERWVVWDLYSDAPGAAMKGFPETRLSFAANGDLFVNPRGNGSRWRVSAGTNATSPPQIERLDLPRAADLFSLCLVSNGAVLTGASGSRLAAYSQGAGDETRWSPTIPGLNGTSPDEKWLAMFRPYSPDLHVYDLANFSPVTVLTNKQPIAQFSFSPRGDEVAVACRKGVEFWSTTTWQRTRHLTNFNGIFYSPDARTLWLSVDYSSAGLYDARTIEPLLPLPPNTRPLALSPDGRRLAVNVDSRRLQLWDLAETRRQLAKLGLDWQE
ncbi:MAG TPA: WD40 repeat domain-containing serine/threonine protein kinase [Verrucomicrobiae bacterium]|nr:WD40 repeat domain-containing serine/threonine protein kinase [Verrucomicrobiae bacterium]